MSAEDRSTIAGIRLVNGVHDTAICPESAARDNGKDGASAPPRRADEGENWDHLLALLQASFAGMKGRIDPPSSLDRMTAADLAEAAQRHEVWLIGSPAIATVTLTGRPDALYIGKLAVLPVHQGQGLMRRLIVLAEGRALARGLPALTLETRVELVENHALFRHLGFVETARRAHAGHDRPTTVEFRKSVSPDGTAQI